MTAASEALRRFMDSLERGIVSRDDLDQLDLGALREVTEPGEVARATDALIARIKAGHDDPRVIDALATIGTETAMDAVSWAARSPTMVLARARAARRLWAMRQDPNALANLQAVARTDAGIVAEEVMPALLEIGSDEAMDVALAMYVSSAQFSVRSSVLSALFLHYGFAAYEQVDTGPIWTLRLGLMSRFPSVRAHALDQLRDLVRRRRLGADDDALDITCEEHDWSAELTEVVTASQDAARPFVDATLAALVGGERAWAVDLVIRALERGEPRAERALETLGGERAKLALADRRAGRVDPE